ncbi:MAG: VWA domain-containing protein [Chloroflexi bacterium]|nr:VWA domain-containing protein [Chloroflexota bacterium]
MDVGVLFEWLREREVEFRAPELLWALVLVPVLLVWYAVARQARRRVAGAFRVAARPPRSTGRVWRAVTLALLLTGLAGAIVGFARPVYPLPAPDDRATVMLVLDASLAMRATDVPPTRFEAATALARAAVEALPDRVQVGVVGYSNNAYILLAPTHDHRAASVATNRLRTSEGAAAGDAIVVALAAIPNADAAAAGTPSGAPTTGQATAPGATSGTASGAAAGTTGAAGPRDGRVEKVPAAIVLIGSGENAGGRALAEAVAAAREAGVPVHTVPVGPRRGTEQKAPFDSATLRQVAQASGGRFLDTPTTTDWKRLFEQLGSALKVERRPREIGHYVGAAGLAVAGVAMLISLLTLRRLV